MDTEIRLSGQVFKDLDPYADRTWRILEWASLEVSSLVLPLCALEVSEKPRCASARLPEGPVTLIFFSSLIFNDSS